MSNLAHKPPLGLKTSRAGDRDKARLSAVAKLPCVICHEYNYQQVTPTQVHHCIMGRFSTRRAPDSMTIPLCDGHHLGMFDTTKVALHRSPQAWRAAYGPDTDWLSWVEERISQ
ncbi:Ref family recombination enhancement nuclease [Actibacterium sp. MT2.3-13A]|uniref:Ref family recombination enhancement nuclease n=1 Tax=Actibacterium sp. MT2.3-13A TaxID=2828332 RepID=UPI001BA7D2EA|nr:Ref family recombination enhancement nuclease [Actibacterium sp. MT2.3-13A]